MRNRIVYCLFILPLFVLAQNQPINGIKPSKPSTIAIINTTIMQNDGSLLPNTTLLISGDQILETGKNVRIPEDALIYDYSDQILVPSFIELHTSMGITKPVSSAWDPKPQIESKKQGAYYWNESVHPEISAASFYHPDEKAIDEFRKMGFGLALTHFPDGIARGTGALIALAVQDENKVLLKSEAAQFFSLEKGVSRQTYPSSQMGSIALLRQVFHDQNWYAKSAQRDTDLSLEAMGRQSHLPMFFKTSDKWEILRAEKIAKEFGFSFTYLGSGNEYEIADKLSKLNCHVVLPIRFPEAYDAKDPYLARQIPLSILKHWELAPSNAYFLEKAKVPFCLSSEGIPHADQFWKNIHQMISRGSSKAAILNALTLEPAKLLGLENKLGGIEAGKLANFSVYSSDPFEQKAKLYESWVLGERKIFEKPIQEDISGRYNLFLKDKKYPMELSLEQDTWNAKITTYKSPRSKGGEGADTLSVKGNIHLNGNDVSIQFNLDDNHWKGSVSLHAKANAKLGILEGDGLLPDGSWIQWAAIKNQKGAHAQDLASKIPLDTLSEPLIWHPNMAYGFDTMPKKSSLLFKNAVVWTNEKEGVLYGANVLVEKGKITHVGTSLPKNLTDVRIIDAKGLHLTSGIIDEHSHIAISKGVNEYGQTNAAEVSIADVINPEDINIYRQLSGGVTAAQLLHGSANPIGGQSALIKLKWGESPEEMLIENAPKFIKFALGENVKQSNWGDYHTERFPQTRMGVEQVYYDGFARARAYQKEWEEYQKHFGGKHHKNIPRKDLELEVLGEILRSERFITCHSYVQSEINMLMHVADSLGFKVNTFTHILEGYKLADKMLKHGAGGSTFSDWWAYKYEVNDAIPYNAAMMQQVGVTVAINSDDAEMGRRLNQEAAKGVKYGGMSEEAAWKMVTLNPAKLLHLDDRMGSIKVGKDADLVLWTEHPLSMQTQTKMTMIDGVIYFDRARNLFMEQKNQQEKARIISKMLSSGSKEEPLRTYIKSKAKFFHCDTLGEEGTTEENTH